MRSPKHQLRKALTDGQIAVKFKQHARAKGHPLNEWCRGCFNRWGFVFPGMHVANLVAKGGPS